MQSIGISSIWRCSLTKPVSTPPTWSVMASSAEGTPSLLQGSMGVSIRQYWQLLCAQHHIWLWSGRAAWSCSIDFLRFSFVLDFSAGVPAGRALLWSLSWAMLSLMFMMNLWGASCKANERLLPGFPDSSWNFLKNVEFLILHKTLNFI